jgi:hypothetical protein
MPANIELPHVICDIHEPVIPTIRFLLILTPPLARLAFVLTLAGPSWAKTAISSYEYQYEVRNVDRSAGAEASAGMDEVSLYSARLRANGMVA